MTTVASKNLQNQYYIWMKSVLSSREGKSCSNISRAEEFYCVYYKDQLELETKPEDSLATKHSFCTLLFSEGSSGFERSCLSWFKQQIHSIIYTTAIWFVTHQDAFEVLADSNTEPASPTHTPELSQGHWHSVGLQTWEQKPSGASVSIPRQLLLQVWGVPAQRKAVVMTCRLELGQQPSRELWLHAAFHRCLSQGSSHWARFKKPKHRNNSAETRQLQKKLQTGGHRPEWLLVCSARVSKPRSARLSSNTTALILAPPEQRAMGQALLSFPIPGLLKRLSQILMLNSLLLLLMGVSCQLQGSTRRNLWV